MSQNDYSDAEKENIFEQLFDAYAQGSGMIPEKYLIDW